MKVSSALNRRRRRWQLSAAVVAVPVLALQLWSAAPQTARAAAASSAQDVDTAQDVESAFALAQREGHRVEVRGLEETSSTTYVNPDGSRTTTESATPIRTERDGALVPVDTSLVASADGAFRPRATDLPVTLGGGGTTTLVTVGMGDGTVAYSWPSALPRPSVDGDTATYADVLSDTDLTVKVTDETVETSYVIKAKPDDSAPPVSMPVALSGVTAQADAAGAVTYHDADTNAVIGQAAAATSSDSSVDPASDSPVTVQTPSTVTTITGTALPAPTQQPDDSTVVQHVPLPGALLTDPDTVYPVVVDPEITRAAGESAYAFVNSQFPNQTYFDTSEDGSRLHMGKDPTNGNSINRALWLFVGMDPLANPQTNVLSATFSAGLSWTSACAPQPVYLYDTGGWGNGITWNNQPPAAGPFASATPPSANTIACGAGHAESSVAFDVTGIIQGQKANSRTDLSIELQAQDQNNSNQWQKWHWNATLSYTYVATPNAVANPTFTQPSIPCTSSAPYPIINSNYGIKFQGTYSTPDANSTLNAGFIITATSDASNWLFSTNDVGFPNNSTQGITIPATQNWEVSGQSYRLDTYAWEPTSAGNYIGPETYCYFTIDNTSPTAPVLVASQQPPAGGAFNKADDTTNLQPGKKLTLNFQAPQAGQHVVGARWAFMNIPEAPTGTTPASMKSCNSSEQGTSSNLVIGYSCLDPSNQTFKVVFDPANAVSGSVYVQFINQADTSSASTQIKFAAQGSPFGGGVFGNSGPPWHYWSTPAGSTADQGSVTTSSLAPPHPGDVSTPLNLGSTGTVATPAANPAPNLAVPKNGALDFSSPPGTGPHGAGVAMATIAASDQTSAHPGADVNWSTGFTVGGWVYPTTYGDNWHHAVLSEDGQNDSLFMLRLQYNNDSNTAAHWEFCVTNDAPHPAAADCVESADLVIKNQWSFVAGTWDPINKQVRVTVFAPGPSSAAGVTTSSASASAPLVLAASGTTSPAFAPGGQIVVGRAKWNYFGGNYDSFAGQIAGAFLSPAPMTDDQLQSQRTRSSN